MKLDHKKFWDAYRGAFYKNGGLAQATVDGLEFVLGKVESYFPFYGCLEAVAYCLATWKHESGHHSQGQLIEFVPTREVMANPQTQPALARIQARYSPFYGRGLVQVTWKDNYYKVGELPGIKGMVVTWNGIDYTINGATLVAVPDLMLDPLLSYRAAAQGMKLGLYRPPHKLSMYFCTGRAPRYFDARDIVNGGHDHAQEIADTAVTLQRILTEARVSE